MIIAPTMPQNDVMPDVSLSLAKVLSAGYASFFDLLWTHAKAAAERQFSASKGRGVRLPFVRLVRWKRLQRSQR